MHYLAFTSIIVLELAVSYIEVGLRNEGPNNAGIEVVVQY